MDEENVLLNEEVISKAYLLLRVLLGSKINTLTEIKESAKIVVENTLKISSENPIHDHLIAEIIKKYTGEVGVKVYDPDVLTDGEDRKHWLQNRKSRINHSYFMRYRLYLMADGFEANVIDNIELCCEKALSRCADPLDMSDLHNCKKRGLVVGDVQSGKTANYLGLINMACDYGYKIIVLLAGMTDFLRSQTQKRTDVGLIGALSHTIGSADVAFTGVGNEKDQQYFAIPLTNTQNDFAKFIQKNLNTTAGDFNKPIVLVVKKNSKILESVKEWLKPGKNNISENNILIIDDEADYASVNTAKPENDPTTVNKSIRGIYNNFPIASYVGYTATPFANIFINPDSGTVDNQDLFPSDFIVQLRSPDTYFGTDKVFGDGSEDLRPIRKLYENEKDFLPVQHQKDDPFEALPESLKEAVLSFLLNNVIRAIRGHGLKHRSMMINISKYNDVQEKIKKSVTNYVERLQRIIEQDSLKSPEDFIKNLEIKKLYKLYTEDGFYMSIKDRPSWVEIQSGLDKEIQQFVVTVINSRYKGDLRFDYDKYKSRGARVIAIGGFVLSRGLTLEGLCVSYYNRNAMAFDTMLQMCRWFGYRPKYEDLCRVYMSQRNIDNFIAVIDSVENLKSQFSEMARQDKTPREFGLMVKECPDTLQTTVLITARNKMQATDVLFLTLNYGGDYADTSKLYKDPAKNKSNMKAWYDFVQSQISIGNRLVKDYGRYMFKKVDKLYIAALLKSLGPFGKYIPYENKKFDVDNLSEYIAESEIFPLWDVTIAGGLSERGIMVDGQFINAPERGFHVENDENFIRIGKGNNRILDPSIFNSGLNLSKADTDKILAEKNAANPGKHFADLTANDYLKIRTTPVLALYPMDLKLDGDDSKLRVKEAFGDDLLYGFAVGFPQLGSTVRLRYRANKVKIEHMTASIEIDEDENNDDD